MNNKKRKITIICATLVLVLSLVASVVSLTGKSASAANVIVSDDEYKVFIGSSQLYAEEGTVKARQNKNNYLRERNQELSRLNDVSEDSAFEAVVVLDDYYTINEVENLVANYGLSIKRAYLWMPGETGRLALAVTDNNISNALLNNIEEVQSKEYYRDESIKKDYESIINGNYGIFSVTVEGKVKDLERISEDNMTELVDVKYYSETEAITRNTNTANAKVTYIELPYKPDGAL